MEFFCPRDKTDQLYLHTKISLIYLYHIVCVFFQGVQVNIQNDDGRTPLMMACYPPEVETRYLNAKTDL
jgi:hypothetical protein